MYSLNMSLSPAMLNCGSANFNEYEIFQESVGKKVASRLVASRLLIIFLNIKTSSSQVKFYLAEAILI